MPYQMPIAAFGLTLILLAQTLVVAATNTEQSALMTRAYAQNNLEDTKQELLTYNLRDVFDVVTKAEKKLTPLVLLPQDQWCLSSVRPPDPKTGLKEVRLGLDELKARIVAAKSQAELEREVFERAVKLSVTFLEKVYFNDIAISKKLGCFTEIQENSYNSLSETGDFFQAMSRVGSILGLDFQFKSELKLILAKRALQEGQSAAALVKTLKPATPSDQVAVDRCNAYANEGLETLANTMNAAATAKDHDTLQIALSKGQGKRYDPWSELLDTAANASFTVEKAQMRPFFYVVNAARNISFLYILPL
jgi:hypothetical protein